MEHVTGTGPPAGSEAFLARLRGWRERLADTTASGPLQGDGEQLDELVTDLEVAYEELRVADEEVAAQHAQIEGLLDDRRVARWRHERMLSVLPVAVMSTDAAGIVRSVNAAAAVLVGQRVARVLGKPVMSFFDLSDRAELRAMTVPLSASTEGSVRRTATLLRRDAAPLSVELTVSPTVDTPHEFTWLILPTPPGGSDDVSTALPTALSRLATLSSWTGDIRGLLVRVVDACAPVFDGLQVSVNVGSPAQPVATATSSTLAQQMDGAQIVSAQGPCVTAFEEARTVVVGDVREDGRWPLLADRMPTGTRGVLAVPLEVGEHLVGALNLYSAGGDWSGGCVQAAELVGATIASVLYERSVRTELEALAADMGRALDSRAVIDQAKGMLMAENRWDADQAFRHLLSLSSVGGVKLRDVARELVERKTAHGPE